MAKLICTRGIPSSGKSTWAKKWVAEDPENRVRVNRDDLRFMLFGMYWGLTYQQEGDVTKAERALVETYLRSGKDVVVDATHLRPKYITEWKKIADKLGVELEIEEFYIDLAEAVSRDLNRERVVGAKVIANMYSKFMPKGKFIPVVSTEAPAPARLYIPDESLPSAIIVDVDGTVARMNGRGPFEEDKVFSDLPIQPIIDLVTTLRPTVDEVIWMSGRTDGCRFDTTGWLASHVGNSTWDPVFMRKAGDTRPDFITKAELFDTHVRDNYNVKLVVDDRASVIDMWRNQLGITTLQVADGDF